MKVIIGPYKNWFGPYQLAELICFWSPKVKDEVGIPRHKPWVHQFGCWLAETKTGEDTILTKLCQWVHKRRVRQVYVKIDKFDTWSMDHTLANIILPMLQQLKQTKHGSPKVDDFDCPQHLWSTNAKPKDDPYDVDEFWHDRWNYVLQEMIWSFEQHPDPNSEDQFYHHQDPKPQWTTKVEVDEAALRQYQHRKQRGFQLFGKYYQSLWD